MNAIHHSRAFMLSSLLENLSNGVQTDKQTDRQPDSQPGRQPARDNLPIYTCKIRASYIVSLQT